MADRDRIARVDAYRVWDSRGWPTIEVSILTGRGIRGSGAAPAGVSRGTREAIDLRDGGTRLGGRDVQKAITAVNTTIARSITGKPINDIATIDRMLLECDGTRQKSTLGGNALTATSLAVLDAAARSSGVPRWKTLSIAYGLKPSMPLPEIQIFGGGAHASRHLDIQDLMVMVPGAGNFGEALEITAEIYHAAGAILLQRGKLAGVADEGGWWPSFRSNDEALETLVLAIESAGETPGDRVVISLDIAASEFYSDGRYFLSMEGRQFDTCEFIEQLGVWLDSYPIASIEDPLSEADPDGMAEFTRRFGERVQIVGDDHFVSNSKLLADALEQDSANAVLLKVNQVGTVLETMETLRLARANDWGTIVSARSGETEDVSVAHIAVGSGSGQIKVGSFARSERMAKWNECLRTEYEHVELAFAGGAPLEKTWWGRKRNPGQ